MKAVCGCGRLVRDYGGVPGVAYQDCDECGANSGNYRQSSRWNHERDKADEKRAIAGQKYKDAMAEVVPLKDKRSFKKTAKRR